MNLNLKAYFDNYIDHLLKEAKAAQKRRQVIKRLQKLYAKYDIPKVEDVSWNMIFFSA